MSLYPRSPDRQISFNTTRWSLVRQTMDFDPAKAMAALSQLCEAYWYPLYAHVRRSGYVAQDAEELTQGFFAKVVEKELFTSASQNKGRLRNFLIICLTRYLGDEKDRSRALKRGGGVPLESFDVLLAEERYAGEPVDEDSPDRLYQRRWCLTLLEHSLSMLRQEYETRGKGELFFALRPFLGFGAFTDEHYAPVAERLGMEVVTLKGDVFRLRKLWQKVLFEQVSMTLENPDPEEIKAELAELLHYL